MLKVIIIYSLFTLNTGTIFSQSSNVKVFFLLKSKRISDSSGLDLYIKFVNSGNDSVYVYRTLTEGSLYSSFSNISVNIEKLENGVYKTAVFKSDDHWRANLYRSDSFFHSSLMKIPYKGTHVAKINLLNVFYSLQKGKYRIKVSLKKIPADIEKPRKMVYLNSRYIYFELLNNLSSYVEM